MKQDRILYHSESEVACMEDYIDLQRMRLGHSMNGMYR